MADAPKILGTDSLKQSYPKLNQAIDMVNDFQRQIDEIVIEGDSSVEAAQARVNADGTSFTTLKERLDKSDESLAEKAAQVDLAATNALVDLKANKTDVTNVLTPKGNIAYASLPTTGNTVGSYYYCSDGDGTHGAGNYVWNGTTWFFGGTGDTGYNTVSTKIDNLKDEPLLPDATVDGRAISVTSGKYGGWDGVTGYSSSKYAVTPGDVLRIISFNNASSYIQFAFYNTYNIANTMSAPWYIPNTAVIYNANGKKVWDIVVPEGAVMLATTVKTGGSCLVYKNTALNSILTNVQRAIKKKKIILDTDLTGDIDDLIAIRLLLWAERQGLIDIIGINLNTKYDTSVDGLDGFLNHDGVRDMCIGLESTASTVFSSYLDTCSNFPHAYRSNYHVEDSLDFYNRALASISNNEKIEIISIGMLTSLKRLIENHAADLSYISNHINKIWVMGGSFPSGHEYNFCGNANAGQFDATVTNNTDYFLKNCPVDVVFCGKELGGLVKTGQILSQQSMTYDLLYKSISAYATTYGTTDLTDGHSSYDPITVLFACEDNVGVSNIDLVRGTASINTTTGDNSFTVSSTGKHYYIVYSHTSNVEWGKMVARKINATLTMENWNIRKDLGKYRLPRIYKNTLLTIPWIMGYNYDVNGGQVVQSACEYAKIDVSAYVGKQVCVRVSAHGGSYCLFEDSNNAVISTFQTDTTTQGVGTVKTVTIPSNAKYLLLSNQWNKVSENLTYAIVIG